ncbi:cell wall hydrolase [Acetobacter senegalensis]|uniref:cell wall hydrolase n=1 Tax=Acetobacter senegalensis TaxID=446692 RepID=UPI00264C130F|nr:cell wall hydrolase [Acetobacter senegalensis]MDN7355799.1 cell wall hydrolase [Acetobacter senegalensis]
MNTPVDIAARTAWGEARGEGSQGMQAVLNVVHNRVAQPGWWGRDVISVCTAPAQFSCWRHQDPNREKLLNVTAENPQFHEALLLAFQMELGQLPDLTDGADHYFDRRTAPPVWACGRFYRKTIGHHAFYHIGLKGEGS